MSALWSWWPRKENVATKEDTLSPRQLLQTSVEMVICGVEIDWSACMLTGGFAFIRIWLWCGQKEVDSILKDSNDQP